MSYAMGTMYATAGLGVSVDKTAQDIATSNGVRPVKESRPVRTLQTLLRDRGFDPGSIDGTWGTRTRSALFSAIGEVTFAVSTDKRQVWLFVSDWGRLQRLPLRGLRNGGGIPVTTEPGGVPDMVGDETNYLPWILGAGALLAVGGWYMMRGQKMRRNPRRRPRRSSR